MLYLAPMAGVADRAFREICRAHGCDAAVSEMVSAKALYYQDKHTKALMERDSSGYFVIQLFGNEPALMARAAEEISPLADGIDINMGCPVKKIVKNREGSALMAEEDLAAEIVYQTVQKSRVPVTVKMRLGVCTETAPSLAKKVEQAGAAAITVHGRFAAQLYTGKADWEAIRRVRESVCIPVIANGDVTCYEDYVKIREVTGCEDVMIGRGALGNPWIFEEILKKGDTKTPTTAEKIEEAMRHVLLIQRYKGERAAVIESRKHLVQYIKGMPNAASLREKLNSMHTVEEVILALQCLIAAG